MPSVSNSSRTNGKNAEDNRLPLRILAAVTLLASVLFLRHLPTTTEDGKREGCAPFSPGTRPADPFRPLDLNTASLEELIGLAGIGEKRAEAIIGLRTRLGFFLCPEDLLLEPTFPAKLLRAVAPHLSAGDPGPGGTREGQGKNSGGGVFDFPMAPASLDSRIKNPLFSPDLFFLGRNCNGYGLQVQVAGDGTGKGTLQCQDIPKGRPGCTQGIPGCHQEGQEE